MNQPNDHKREEAVVCDPEEVLKIIDTHRVTVVGDVASDEKKTCGTYKASDLVNDDFP